MAVMTQNQSNYLNGLLKGGGGNAAWAQSQLQGSTIAPIESPTGSPTQSQNPNNQSAYLNNLIAGGGGNAEWAKAQLAATPSPQVDPALVAQHQAAADQFRANNWGPNGTANGQTQAQNLAAVINQPGNAVQNNLTPYLSGILNQAKTDTQGTNGGGTFNTAGVAGTDTSQTGGSVVQGGGQNYGMSQGQTGQDYIQNIYNNSLAAQQAQNKITRDTQLAGLAGQDTTAQNNATNSLNANDVSGARLANQLREHMANLGLGQGGDYISQQVAQDASQGDNANHINQNLSATLQNLAAQKSAINNNAAASDMSVLQQLQAQMGQNQLGQFNTDRSFGLQQNAQNMQAGQNTFNNNLATNQFGLQKSAQDYNQNPNNPTNIGLGLNNQLTQLKLSDYPAQSKAAAQEVQQKLAAGEITNQDAQLKLDQLKDPNSLTNQKIKADIDLTNSQSTYYKDHGSYYAGGGSQNGSNSANRTAANNSYTGSVYDQLSQLDPSDYQGYLEANRGEIVNNIGQKAYDEFAKSVMADQNTQGKADTAQGKADATLRSQAIASAQKDSRWLDGKTSKTALIKEYEGYHTK